MARIRSLSLSGGCKYRNVITALLGPIQRPTVDTLPIAAIAEVREIMSSTVQNQT
jgi:hypothetical protein